MIRLIRGEFAKIVRTPTTWYLLGCSMAVIALLAAIALAGSSEEMKRSLSEPGGVLDTLETVGPLCVLSFVFGLLAVTAEYRHGTMTPVALATPRRWRIVAAKMVTYTVVSPVIVMAAFAAAGVVTSLWLVASGLSAPLIDGAAWAWTGRYIVMLSLIGLFGVGLGAIVRSQVAAVIGGIIWLWLVESILMMTVPSVAKWLPFVSVDLFTRGPNAADLPAGMPAWWVSGLVFAAWTAAALAGGTFIVRRRDIL
jgi:ABC-2 type transport system permease protein